MLSTKSTTPFDNVSESSFDLYQDEDQTGPARSLSDYYRKHLCGHSGDRIFIGQITTTNFFPFLAVPQALCINELEKAFTKYIEKLSCEDSAIRRDLIEYFSLSLVLPAETKVKTQDSLCISSLIEKHASDACIDFCNSLGITHLLKKVLEQVLQTFSNIIRLRAEFDFFDEDEDNDDNQGHIAISLEIGSSQVLAFEEYDQWTNWLLEAISPEERAFFTLAFKRR